MKKIQKNAARFDNLKQDFLDDKKYSGTAEATLNGYRYDITRFLKFLSDEQLAVNEAGFKRYVIHLTDSGMTANSVNHYIRSVKVFLYWCMEQDEIAPFKIKMVKAQETIKDVYTQGELCALIQPPKREDSFVVWRSWAIINFILGTAAREATVCEMQMQDVSFDDRTITFRHLKNKHVQLLPMSEALASCLKKYISLWRQDADEKQSAEAFDKIAALVEAETPSADEPQESEPPQPEQTAFEKYAVVYEQNSDFVGWISIERTNIDYPVMQTIDNPNYYLKHSFDKQYSDYGVPYVQENCDLGLSDNCVIYGHHMNNGSMFADLCKYESEDFYQEHKTVRFDTLSGFGEYEVVAVFKTVAYSEQGFKYYHFTRAESAEDFDAYIVQCKALSLYDTGVTVEYGDRLITLSTCEYSRKNGRMVVVAKRIAAPSAEVGSDA